jgi:hypothetical protein
MNMKNWKRVTEGENPLLKVYEHKKTGNIRVIYPKAPKWAQRAAMRIYVDLESGGMPTDKGVTDIVLGLWAKIISEER